MIPTLYTVREACRILKVSPRTLERMIERGEIAYTHRRGCHILFSERVLDEYIQSLEVTV
jgi:excisionase family DNA binding protein